MVQVRGRQSQKKFFFFIFFSFFEFIVTRWEVEKYYCIIWSENCMSIAKKVFEDNLERGSCGRGHNIFILYTSR